MNLHRLLGKQIKKYLPDNIQELDSVKQFLHAVNSSYNAYEKDQTLSSHAFKISEQEYASINEKLLEENKIKRAGIKNLKEAICNVEDSNENKSAVDVNEDNLLDTVSYLNEQILKRKNTERQLKNSENHLSAAANRLSQLISNLHNGVLLEDENGRVILTNQLFCDMFFIPMPPYEMNGADFTNFSQQSKHLFKYPEKFIEDTERLLRNRVSVIGDEMEMADGKILQRDYVPVYVSNEYKGHLWKYNDITLERERANQLQWLSLVASANENGVAFCDASGSITWTNRGYSLLTGYSREEAMGNNITDLCIGKISDRVSINKMNEALAERKGFIVEVAHYRRDGSWFCARVKGQSVPDNYSASAQYFIMIEDITREKADQQKLKEFETRFREAFEKIGDNVWEHDFTTGTTYFSNTKSHLLGYDLEEFAATPNLWLEKTHYEDRQMLNENDQKYRSREIDHHMLEYRVLHKDGSIRWVMDRGVVIELSSDGKPLKTIGTHTDITERKLAEQLLQREEQKYRGIIANMNLGLLEVDSEDRIIFTNQSFCDMSGYTVNELIGNKAAEFFAAGDYLELIKNKSQSRAHRVMDAYEISVKNKSGQLRWWFVSGAPRYDDKGELVGSIGIHLDITDRRQLETDLIEAREEAEQSTRSKELFLANMSHEIRTPMNAILGMTNLLKATTLDSKQLFYLNTIDSASENLLIIINDILDISKIQAGKMQIESIGFEPAAVLNRAIQVTTHKAEEKGLSLKIVFCDTRLHPVLIGDPYRINQVLLNLITNAIKFTEKGGVEISCRLLEEDLSSQTIEIKILDTGIGMDEMFVKNLFEKFSQEDVSVTRRYGGTGLGMTICKDLIGLMGGEIFVESEKNKGTSISFKVTFFKGGLMDLPQHEIVAINKDVLANKQILLVDDNAMNRLVAQTILNNYGAIITEAVNGQEAIDLLQGKIFDLVLMDIQMPVMGGMEATKIIREQISESIPVIALTANAIKGDNEKCLFGGMNAYLSKPFKENDLLNIIALWVNKK